MAAAPALPLVRPAFRNYSENFRRKSSLATLPGWPAWGRDIGVLIPRNPARLLSYFSNQPSPITNLEHLYSFSLIDKMLWALVLLRLNLFP
jgi:hypothetical protein